MTLLSALGSPIVVTILRLVLIVLLVILAEWALRFAARQIGRGLEKVVQDPDHRERIMTIVQVVHGTVLVLVIIVAGLTMLQVLGVSIAPLLAGVSVVGLALSLGAQTLIKDYVGGLLILIENQYAIGDVIQVAGVQGEVERITLRATCLRDLDGRYHVVPNGDIRLVSNLTMEWARAIVELNVDYRADMGQVLRTLEEAASKARADDAVRADLLEPPQVLGWVGFKNRAIQVRLTAKTRPGKQWSVATALRRYAVEALQAEGVQVRLPL